MSQLHVFLPESLESEKIDYVLEIESLAEKNEKSNSNQIQIEELHFEKNMRLSIGIQEINKELSFSSTGLVK